MPFSSSFREDASISSVIYYCVCHHNLNGGTMDVKDRYDFFHSMSSLFCMHLFTLLCIFPLFSCTITKPAVIDSQLAMQKGYEQFQEGLRIYIRPLRDKNEIEKYFGANLLEKNILPTFVLAENKSESKTFLVEPANQLQENPKSKQNGKSIEAEKNSSEYITATEAKNSVYEKDTGLEKGLILTGPIFWLAAIPIAMADYGPTDASKSLQQALITKSLRRQTLTPGKTESGFLYYRIPRNMSSGKNVGINLKATNLDTLEVMYFRFTKELSKEEGDAKK